MGVPKNVIAVGGLAVLLSGCSGSSHPATQTAAGAKPTTQTQPSTSPPQVSLKLLDGGPAKRLRACDVLTNYPTYKYGGFVRYEGRITPPPAGKWTVQVKLKRCVPNGYSETFMEIVDGRPDGSFSGVVPKLNPNEFYVWAQYRPAAGRLYLSDKEYFRVVRG